MGNSMAGSVALHFFWEWGYTFCMEQKRMWLVVIGLGIIIAILLILLIVIPAKAPVEPNLNLAPTSTETIVGVSGLLVVDSPQPNSLIKSPLTVSGSARGNWFFEASFPVRILDAEERELGVVPAQAKSDWMTTDFVNFSAVLDFKTPTTATGTLVFEKDNPSGLPQNDQKFEMLVRFR